MNKPGLSISIKAEKLPKMKIPKKTMRIRAMRWMKKNSPDLIKMPKV
jgi:hypothetical protein